MRQLLIPYCTTSVHLNISNATGEVKVSDENQSLAWFPFVFTSK